MARSAPSSRRLALASTFRAHPTSTSSRQCATCDEVRTGTSYVRTSYRRKKEGCRYVPVRTAGSSTLHHHHPDQIIPGRQRGRCEQLLYMRAATKPSARRSSASCLAAWCESSGVGGNCTYLQGFLCFHAAGGGTGGTGSGLRRFAPPRAPLLGRLSGGETPTLVGGLLDVSGSFLKGSRTFRC